MIKIEDTHREEEETPQETMTTSMEDSMAQKIRKALDEHGEAHKKMGGISLGLRNLSSRSLHMWESMMMKRKWKKETKRTKQNTKGTSNLRSSLHKP